MPRKAAATIPAEDAEPPRRSTRVKATATEPAPPAPKVTKPKAVKAPPKRVAEEDAEEGPSKKKTKADKEAESPAVAALDIGDVLPSITLKNEKDEDVDVSQLAAEKGLVLFLVPKADTPGCTTQACGFRDLYPDFTASNYNVYCLSADTSAAQTKWQTKKTLPYPLLSDRSRILIKALGALNGTSTKRSHFIFEKGGKLLDKQLPVKAADSPKLALEFIKSLS